MKEVPLIRTLPQNFQVEMYSLLKHAAFADGDYIVKQGDVGDKFYIITDGAADVVQEKFENDQVERKTLVRLYEGHFFGEMALVFDEPRIASVFAVGKTSCLTLSKVAFTKALSAEQFQVMMQDVAYQRAEVREKREKKEQAEIAAKATINRITSTNSDMAISMNSIASIAPLFSRNSTANSLGGGTPRGAGSHSGWDSDGGGSDSERNVTTTNKLVKRKLSTGQKFINKYIILKEIGRGAFGYVYLCKSEEDDQLYAMKSISKATRKWNVKLTDDVKTEIAVMKSLRHQNVVSLLEVIDDPTAKQIYLVQVSRVASSLCRELCNVLCCHMSMGLHCDSNSSLLTRHVLRLHLPPPYPARNTWSAALCWVMSGTPNPFRKKKLGIISGICFAA